MGLPKVDEARAPRVLAWVMPDVDPELVREALSGPEVEIALAKEADAEVLEGDYDVLLLACRGYSDELRRLVERVVSAAPGRSVLIVSWSVTSSFLRQLVTLGAHDVVLMPAEEERLRDTLSRTLERDEASTQGQVVGVVGVKGGVGKTTVAANLAVSLARHGQRVALIDADLQFGDVGIVLGLEPERTLYDLAQAGRLDEEKLQAFMERHSSGLDVLLAPTRPEQAQSVPGEMLEEIWRLLEPVYDYVVVDTCPGLTPEVLALVDAASRLYVVSSLDVSSLKDTRLGLDTLDRLGYDTTRVSVVLNRVRSGVGLGVAAAGDVLGREPAIVVADDVAVARATNLGRAVADGKAAESLAAMAAALLGVEPAKARRWPWQRRSAPAYVEEASA